VNLARKVSMTAEEFVDWAMAEPHGRYELVHGEVVAMAPERAAHARVKGAAYRMLHEAVRAAGRGCEAFGDGMAIRIDATTVYEPVAQVRCGARLPGDAVFSNDPVIVVEVLSPSTRDLDTGAKLAGYFALPSLRHYLILNPMTHEAIHHRREDGGRIVTEVLTGGSLTLDPPGLVHSLAALFVEA
jgi:Uma2 family endonuclease